ncbi:hypothetical protein JYU34_015720 [Plutella xylostella]|uniref:RRM domain-containing protein n=1 Tax=Plutella xylostella TaxID=51655 RepID=A0ABQ7Q4K1_PLUXY|nr:uncharacterized protein LOC119693139 [Plutella xylostella]KAG7300171.1 hypothetical protein JYU34_015720 [Plutella xylostella]
MFFDEEDERNFNPELFRAVHREFYAISSDLEVARYGLRSVPTHTEDGIPIRKLYVSNLPPKTTRTELFGVFAQYGFIKSCWLRMGEKGPNKTLAPTYAFVTFSNPADAHKALLAPNHEKALRGRTLRISPADSWHQPAEDANGRVHWKPRGHNESEAEGATENVEGQEGAVAEASMEEGEATTSQEGTNMEAMSEDSAAEHPGYSILEILNRDCLAHVLSYVPVRDLIRSERVSKDWQSMVHEYLQGIRVFKTSWWQHGTVTLTTAVLRRVLQRLGAALTRLHIDHHWSALNDRTAHTVGKFCPNLEELKVVGMYTRNWNPLTYGCKQLKNLSFISCNKLTDSSLVNLVKQESCIESLTVANNTHVTGLFLTGANPTKLHSLAFYNCFSLQGTVLCAAIETLPVLTTLKLDVGATSLWKIVPLILNKLPKLEELSLSEYSSVEDSSAIVPQGTESLCEAFSKLTELKTLNLSRNIYISNAVLKQVAQSCPKLETLNVSSCNSRKNFPHAGVGDEGLAAICKSCTLLRTLDMSYLAGATDAGAGAAAGCPTLASLTARGNSALTAAPFARCLENCHYLEELDLCGCDSVSEEVAAAAARALAITPRPLVLRLAATLAATTDFMISQDFPSHKLLSVNVSDDRCNPHLRPDFVDRIFEDSSDGSLDDVYEHDHFDDFLNSDDDLFLEDELEEYDDEVLYQIEWGVRAQHIVLL